MMRGEGVCVPTDEGVRRCDEGVLEDVRRVCEGVGRWISPTSSSLTLVDGVDGVSLR
jgi:hypothetical protein